MSLGRKPVGHHGFLLLAAMLGIGMALPLSGREADQEKVKWIVEISAQNGKLTASDGVVNSYRPDRIRINGNEITLLNDNPQFNGKLSLNAPDLLNRPPKLLLAEWKTRILSEDGTEALEVSIGPSAGKPKEVYGLFFRLSGDQVAVPGGKADVRGINLRTWNVFQTALDTESGEGALWINGRLCWQGKVRIYQVFPKPFAHIGDDSTAITGNVALEYFKLGRRDETAR